MAKMTKAQARKRLVEVINKMEKVRVASLMMGDFWPITANDLNKMWKMELDIQKLVNKLK